MNSNKNMILKKADELGMEKGVQKIMMELLETEEKQEKMLRQIEIEHPKNPVYLFAMTQEVKYCDGKRGK